MPNIDYNWLRRRLRIQDILEWMHWHSSEQRGHQHRGPCPLCGQTSDGSRSSQRCFSVNFARNIFRCFHCHRQGNALDLWAFHQQLPLHQAANQLLQILSQPSSNPKTKHRKPPN
jgi:DNA primase